MAEIKLITKSAFDYLAFDHLDVDALLVMRDSKGGYWERAFEFVASLMDRDQRELSTRQIKWGTDIKNELDDMRRRGEI